MLGVVYSHGDDKVTAELCHWIFVCGKVVIVNNSQIHLQNNNIFSNPINKYPDLTSSVADSGPNTACSCLGLPTQPVLECPCSLPPVNIDDARVWFRHRSRMTIRIKANRSS